MPKTSTKRRCAGCHKVISNGRADRQWCTDACRKRHERQLARTKNVRAKGPIESVIRGSNGVLIAHVARLGYLGHIDDPVLDVTPGRGKWWTRYRPNNLYVGGPDFRHQAELDDESMPIICYDPPYISTGNRDTSTVDEFYDRYGLGELNGWKAIRTLIDEGLAECARILTDDGYLLVKCMDYVESGRKVWNTFHVAAEGERLNLRLVDRFIHLSGGGPQTMTNLDGSPREQKHAREVSSMLLVFTK